MCLLDGSIKKQEDYDSRQKEEKKKAAISKYAYKCRLIIVGDGCYCG